MKFSLALLALSVASASAGVANLTPENYDSLTAGKTVFIKFFAPWCGHCKKMAPDWETLAGKWEGHEVGLIAEVDCTTDAKPLCEENGVKGFPTLKYGDPGALEDYKGGRTLKDFEKFCDENLKPVCSVTNIDLCDDEKKALIAALMAKPDAELDAEIKAAEATLASAETDFKAAVEQLQKTYESLTKDKEEKEQSVKDAGLTLMKAVKKAKSAGSDEL